MNTKKDDFLPDKVSSEIEKWLADIRRVYYEKAAEQKENRR